MSIGYFGCMNDTGYEWVRGNRTRPATKGVLVLKIGVIAITYKPRGVIEITIQTLVGVIAILKSKSVL
jgi:hypothetical protein